MVATYEGCDHEPKGESRASDPIEIGETPENSERARPNGAVQPAGARAGRSPRPSPLASARRCCARLTNVGAGPGAGTLAGA